MNNSGSSDTDGYEAWLAANERGMSHRGCLWAISVSAASVLLFVIFVQASGHPGFSVRVTNHCDHEVLSFSVAVNRAI